jgi:hypothetical protein
MTRNVEQQRRRREEKKKLPRGSVRCVKCKKLFANFRSWKDHLPCGKGEIISVEKGKR